jgi:Flp pilus assembly pilin Flp
MTLSKLNKILTRKTNRGQTALEYALVVGAISLVIMAAWNVVGDKVKSQISGVMLQRISDNLEKGNGTIKR